MRILLAGLALAGLCGATAAAETSVYTDLDAAKDCVTYAAAKDGDGDWADLVCSGYRGYPVFSDYDDARESVFYGFPPDSADARPWESFSGFNTSGPRIEWRLDPKSAVPFAAIHRRTVGNPDDPDAPTEVLVVAKVGQPGERDGCTVGLVVATGNATANDMARRLADEQARDFACGADERVIVSGEVALPEFSRAGPVE